MSIRTGAERVVIREVGPRDGLQAADGIMPTEVKLRWIDALVAAGVSEIEIASFVPPSLLPQMADADAVTRSVRARHPNLREVTLAPNLRGAQNAAAAGSRLIVAPVSASDAHNERNIRKTAMQQVAVLAEMVQWAKSLPEPVTIEAAISTAFGCSIQGRVPVSDVVRLAGELASGGVERISVADTLGYATPSQVREVIAGVRAEVGDRLGNLHLHDTLGVGLANVMAGLEAGVRAFDAALAGLGGCPFAPGSVGNVATEDVVYLLESEGFDTGIDLDALIRVREYIREGLPSEPLHGRVASAGIPKTFRPAAGVAA